MTGWIDTVCVLIVLLSLSLLAAHRIAGMIRLFALQSLVLSPVPVLISSGDLSIRVVLISIVTLLLKAALVPAVLFWAMRHNSMRSEVKPLMGFSLSIFCGALIIAVAFWIAASLSLPVRTVSDMVLPCSLATVLLGFMTMVTRTRAVTQVLGYLTLENGIFLFGACLFDTMPFAIELGILLDIFVAVFIMAIIVNHITEEFERSPASLSRSKMGESF
jgi:hydrogenase-4 component E